MSAEVNHLIAAEAVWAAMVVIVVAVSCIRLFRQPVTRPEQAPRLPAAEAPSAELPAPAAPAAGTGPAKARYREFGHLPSVPNPPAQPKREEDAAPAPRTLAAKDEEGDGHDPLSHGEKGSG